jgi:hypothetical protein
MALVKAGWLINSVSANAILWKYNNESNVM